MPRRSSATTPSCIDLLDKLADGTGVEGMEALAPVLADGMELLVDLLPEGSLVVVCDPERVRTRAHDLVATSEEFLEASWHNAAAGNVTPIDLRAAAYRSVGDVRQAALERGIPWWAVSPFGGDMADDDDLAALDPDAIDRLSPDTRPAESLSRRDGARVRADGRVAARRVVGRPRHGRATARPSGSRSRPGRRVSPYVSSRVSTPHPSPVWSRS